jgi:hypothetical protein
MHTMITLLRLAYLLFNNAIVIRTNDWSLTKRVDLGKILRPCSLRGNKIAGHTSSWNDTMCKNAVIDEVSLCQRRPPTPHMKFLKIADAVSGRKRDLPIQAADTIIQSSSCQQKYFRRDAPYVYVAHLLITRRCQNPCRMFSTW